MNDKKIKAVETTAAPKAIGPYSQAVVIPSAQKLIFVSGQLPVDLATGKLIEGDAATMTRAILNSIKAILHHAGSSLDNIVRVEIFCTDLKRDFPAINEEYGQHFTGLVKPARQTIQVAALPLGAIIEISCIAIGP